MGNASTLSPLEDRMSWEPSTRFRMTVPESLLVFPIPWALFFGGAYGSTQGIFSLPAGVPSGLICSIGLAVVSSIFAYPLWRALDRLGDWAERRRAIGLKCRCGRADFQHADILPTDMRKNYELENECRCSCSRTYAVHNGLCGNRLVEILPDGRLEPHLKQGHFSPWRSDTSPVKSKDVIADWLVPFLHAAVLGVVAFYGTNEELQYHADRARGKDQLSWEYEAHIIRLAMIAGSIIFGFLFGCVMVWRQRKDTSGASGQSA